MKRLVCPALYIGGCLALIMCGPLLIVTVFSLTINDGQFGGFLFTSELTIAVSLLLITCCRRSLTSLSARHLYLVTTFAWAALSLIGALPFYLGADGLSLSDSVFEAVSGVTTTGSTIMDNLAERPASLLLWRSLLQWIGGLGVILMAVAILPFLQIGGMKLFQTENSDWSDKSVPRFQKLAVSMLLAYIVITAACTFAYYLDGIEPFTAINFAMTTVSTGGFAPVDSSMADLSPTTLWTAVFFMLIGGLPLTAIVLSVMSRTDYIFSDQQCRCYLGVLVTGTALITGYLMVKGTYPGFAALTQAAFNVTSIITTTGFNSGDYQAWGQFSIGLFFIAMFIGGCSGSTAGGIKVFRFQLSYLFLVDQFQHLVHPRGVFSISYNNKRVGQDIMASTVAFSFLFFVSLAFITLVLTLFDLDLVTSLTAAATSLTNVGPGLGDQIGPIGNFKSLPTAAKWVLSFGMVLGRLEMITIMVILSPVYWRV